MDLTPNPLLNQDPLWALGSRPDFMAESQAGVRTRPARTAPIAAGGRSISDTQVGHLGKG